MNNQKNILVLGANGQLGYTLKNIFPNAIFLLKSEFSIQSTQNEYIEFLEKTSTTVIINCAAYTHVDLAEDEQNKAFEINAHALKNLSEVCFKKKIHLIHISTDYVFSGEKNSQYSETDIANPVNSYGQSKLLGEKIIQESNCQYTIIRTSWLYSEYNKNFVKTIIQLLRTKNELKIINDQFGSPTSCYSLARILPNIISNQVSRNQLFHFSNSGITSWFEFAQEIKRLMIESGINIQCEIIPIKTEEYGQKARRPKFSALDSRRIHKLMNLEIVDWKSELAQNIKQILTSMN